MTHDPVDLLAAAAPRLSRETRTRHLQILAAEQAASPDPDRRSGSSRRRRRWIAATAGAAVLFAGVGTAAAWVGREKPTVRDTARCFAIATTEFGDLEKSGEAYFDLTYLLIDPTTGEVVERDQTPQHAIEGCANSWRVGGIAGTKPYLRDLDPDVDFQGQEPATHPVPGLVACLLPTGQVGVFPDTDCAALDLPEADLS